MNKTYFAILLFGFLFFHTNCSPPKESIATSAECAPEPYVDSHRLIHYKLKGKVKEVRERFSIMPGTEFKILRFDTAGFLVGEEIRDHGGIKELRIINRDSLNRIVYDSTHKQTYDYFKDQYRNPSWEVNTSEFDEAGRLVSSKTIRSDGKNSETIRRFNARGCLEFESILAGRDNTFTERTYIYDDKNRVKEFLEKVRKRDQTSESRIVKHFEGDVFVKSEDFVDGKKEREDVFVQTDSGQTQYIILFSEEGARDTAHISKWNKKEERVEDIYVKEKGKFNRYEYFTENNISNLIQKNYRGNELRSVMIIKRNKNDVQILQTLEYMGKEITREEWDELGNPIISHKKGINPFNGEKIDDEITIEYTYEKDQQGNWITCTETETKKGEGGHTGKSIREIIYW